MIVPHDLPVHYYGFHACRSEGAFHYNARFGIMLVLLGPQNERYNDFIFLTVTSCNVRAFFV